MKKKNKLIALYVIDLEKKVQAGEDVEKNKEKIEIALTRLSVPDLMEIVVYIEESGALKNVSKR